MANKYGKVSKPAKKAAKKAVKPTVVEDRVDHEYDPSVEPQASDAWLNLIEDSEKKFEDYNKIADEIDDIYAKLERLASDSRDRQFQLFWSNIDVLKGTIYARTPVPVCTPKFKDRLPINRITAEILERCTVAMFDEVKIDQLMRMLRDDLIIDGRAVAWVRLEEQVKGGKKQKKICIDFVDRRDFAHDPARNWRETGWAARRGWLTIDQMRERFAATSKDAYKDAIYNVQKKDNPLAAVDPREKCAVWELWSKEHDKVVWVSEGVDVLLDEGKPHLDVEEFFPTPEPIYTTLQRRSLVPVPDMLYYRDQLEEINLMTARIHALSYSLQVKGFYPSGGEIGEAVETALKANDNRRTMIPVKNWAAFGSGGDVIIWLPIEMIAKTVVGLIEARRQVIEDVYQIMGLSDIMRGQADTGGAKTATEQNIKAQAGSVRVREKQNGMARYARDLAVIAAEIMAENFPKERLLEMSQMQVATDAEVEKQVHDLDGAKKDLLKSVEQAKQRPEVAQMAQQNPQAAQAMLQQVQQQVAEIDGQIAKTRQTVTIEQVMKLLRDQRLRPFILDIETDSTIQPDEDAEKQRRSEFMQVFSQASASLGQMVQLEPAFAPLAGQMLKFALAPFRAGRELEGAIDEFVEQMTQKAKQPRPNPEAEKLKAETQVKMADIQQRDAADKRRIDLEGKTKLAEDERERAKIASETILKRRDLEHRKTVDAATADREERKITQDAILKREDMQVRALEGAANRADAAREGEANRQSSDVRAGAERQLKRDESKEERRLRVEEAETSRKEAREAAERAFNHERSLAEMSASSAASAL